MSQSRARRKESLLYYAASFEKVLTGLFVMFEMSNTSYTWKELKEQLGEDIDSKVKGMVFLKGKQGVCFDIPTASVTEVQGKWHDSRRWQLSVATEQPELEGPREGYRNFRGQREGNRGFRGQARPTKVSGDSRKEVEASKDSDQEVATKVTDSKIKARSRVLIKHSDSTWK